MRILWKFLPARNDDQAHPIMIANTVDGCVEGCFSVRNEIIKLSVELALDECQVMQCCGHLAARTSMRRGKETGKINDVDFSCHLMFWQLCARTSMRRGNR